MYLLLRIYFRDNTGGVLEVGDKLLIYIQDAEGNLSPMGDSCAVSPRSARQRGLAAASLLHLLLVQNRKHSDPIMKDYC